MPGEIQRYELGEVDCMGHCYGGVSRMEKVEGAAVGVFPDDEWVKFTDHQAAVTAAVEERDRQWREHIESGRPLIFNHRGAVAPAATTDPVVKTNPEEGED